MTALLTALLDCLARPREPDEDVEVGRCLEAVGVQPYRTVDTYGRETFHPWSLDYTLFSSRRTKYELHPKVAVSAVGLVGSVLSRRVVFLDSPTSRSLHPSAQNTYGYVRVHAHKAVKRAHKHCADMARAHKRRLRTYAQCPVTHTLARTHARTRTRTRARAQTRTERQRESEFQTQIKTVRMHL